MLLYPTHLHKYKTKDKHNNLDINLESSGSESEFEDGLHSQYAPQGAPQVPLEQPKSQKLKKKQITLPLLIVS